MSINFTRLSHVPYRITDRNITLALTPIYCRGYPMRVFNLILILICVSCLNSPENEDKPKVVYSACTQADQLQNKCTRFMDRKIFLSFSQGLDPNKNNEFQKIAVRQAFREIEELTNLGSGYFTFEEIDPVFIEPIVEPTTGTVFRSFVQILPDAEFNGLANRFGFIPDQNSITVINAANKRQFYLVIRASCFNPNDPVCTNDIAATMGTLGIKALIARQLGVLTGMPLSCLTFNKTMCADFPRDDQWSTMEKNSWAASFNNSLETIANNPGFYEEFFIE